MEGGCMGFVYLKIVRCCCVGVDKMGVCLRCVALRCVSSACLVCWRLLYPFDDALFPPRALAGSFLSRPRIETSRVVVVFLHGSLSLCLEKDLFLQGLRILYLCLPCPFYSFLFSF